MIARIFLLASVAHQAKQRAGIDTGRQKNPDLDIGQQMRPDAVERRRRARVLEARRQAADLRAPSARIAAMLAKGFGSRGPAASTHWLWPAGSARISR